MPPNKYIKCLNGANIKDGVLRDLIGKCLYSQAKLCIQPAIDRRKAEIAALELLEWNLREENDNVD